MATTKELLDPEITRWLTENVTYLRENRGGMDDETFQELMVRAESLDSTRVAQWQTYHDTIAEGQKAGEDRLRVTKRALESVSDPDVRAKLEEDAGKELQSSDGLEHLKEKFSLFFGNPKKAIEEFRNRPADFEEPLGAALEELADENLFQGRFREGLEANPPRKGESAEARTVRVAESHTALGAALQTLTALPREATLSQLNAAPSDIRQAALEPVLEKHPELGDIITKNRGAFESYALARKLYLQAGAGREQLAMSLVEEGRAPSFNEAMTTVTDWLEEAHRALVGAKGLLPDTGTSARGLEGASLALIQPDPSKRVVDPLALPPAPNRIQSGDFHNMLAGVGRALASFPKGIAKSFGDPDVEARAALAFPSGAEPGTGLSVFGLFNINAFQFGEMVGWTLGTIPQFAVAGPVAGAAGKIPAVAKAATKVPGIIRGAARAGTELGVAEAITPEEELGDIGGRAKRAAAGALGGAVAGGALGVVGAGLKGAGKGVKKLGELVQKEGKRLEKPPPPRSKPKLPVDVSDVAPKIEGPPLVPQEPAKAFKPAAQEGRLPVAEAKTLGGQIRKGPGTPNPAPNLKDPTESASLAQLNKGLSGAVDPPSLPDISKPVKGDFNRQIVRDLDAIGDTRKAAEFIHKGALRNAAAQNAKEGLKMREVGNLIPKSKRQKASELITFAVEQTGDPRIPGDTAAGVLQRLKKIKGAEEAASRYRDIVEEGRRRINDYAEKNLETEEQLISFLEDYVSHFWVPPKGTDLGTLIRRWRKRVESLPKGGGPAIRVGGAPSGKKRLIPTFADGMEMGLTPKTLNAFDLHGLWAQANWRTVANQEAFRELRKLTTRDGSPVFLPGAKEFAARGEYQTIRSGIFKDGVARVHEEIAPVVKQMVERPLSGRFGRFLDRVNAYTKVVNLSLSGFHHVALIESMWASMKGPFLTKPFIRTGAVDPLTRRRTFLQFPLLRARKILQDEGAIDLLAEGGVQLTKFEPHVGFGMVWNDMVHLEKWLDDAAANASKVGLLRRPTQALLKAGKTVPKAVRKAIGVNNAVLWDFLHNGSKAYTYLEHAMHAVEKAAKKEAAGKPIMSKLTGRPISRAEILNDVGDFVNRAYGGLEWQTQYWASPELQRNLRRYVFALDWTVANTQIAAAPFSKGIKGKLGRRYVRNMAASLAAAQAGLQWFAYQSSGGDELNRKISDKSKKHSPWMWDNGSGKTFNVDMTPWFHSRGLWTPGEQRIYISLGKQAREPLRWITEPVKQALNKSAPIIDITMDTIETVHQSDYGWRLGGEETGQIFTKKFSERFRPFSFSDTQFAFSVPKKRGLSEAAIKKQMEASLRTFAEPSAWHIANPKRWDELVLARDPKVVGAYEQLVDDMIDVARRNGHDPGKILPKAVGSARAQFSRDFMDAWKGSKRDPKTGKIGILAQGKMEAAAKKMALMDASLEYWKKRFETKKVKLTKAEEDEIEVLVKRAFEAIGK